MTTLSEQYVVQCPYVRARDYLAKMLETEAAEGRERTLTLNAPVPYLPELQKNVLVHYAVDIDPMHFDQPWHVSWIPEGGGPYPDFEGDLTVRADEGYGSAILELRGAYRPPLGLAGHVFDAALGHKIATATAQSLLKTLADEMMQRYTSEEAAKKQGVRS